MILLQNVKTLLSGLFLFIFLFSILGCDEASTTDTPTPPPPSLEIEKTEKPNIPKYPEPAEGEAKEYSYYCFKHETPFANEPDKKDVEELNIEVINDKYASGEYNFLPAFRDQRKGTIKGMKVANRVEGTYTFIQEGKEETASIKITFRASEAIIVVEPTELKISAIIPKVDCPKK